MHVKKDVGDALRMLDGILSRNKVKYQLRMTERHEKKGYKRRRLASERWRNQFANEVRHPFRSHNNPGVLSCANACFIGPQKSAASDENARPWGITMLRSFE